MYHNILLRHGQPQHAPLTKAVELLLSFSMANTIYFSPHLEEGVNEGLIIVMVSEGSPFCYYELNEHYWKLFEAFPEFTFRIFDGSWMEDSLESGNPFFAIHCHPDTLVYSTAESAEIGLAAKLKPKRFLKMARSEYGSEEHAASMSGINLKYYQRNGDFLQAMFLLHQNIRALFMAAEWFLCSESLMEDDLGIHQSHLARYAKALGKAFDVEKEEERMLLEALDGARNAVEKGTSTATFTVEQVEAATVKKELIRMEVGRLFRECCTRCQDELARGKAPLLPNAEKHALKTITSIITQAVKPAALYCFGERHFGTSAKGCVFDAQEAQFQTTHYYLFVIVKEYQADVPGNLSYMIKEQTNGRCTATVVMHSKKSLRQKQGDQQYFFHRIMERGRLLFKEGANPPYLLFDKAPARNYQLAKTYLSQRMRTASFLRQAEGLDGGGATKIHVYLMRLVVEQTCLGLIRLFLGYTPHQYALQFLFELCGYFTPLTAELFPRETDKDRELLKILSGDATSLRHCYNDGIDTHDYEVLNSRCNEFVDRSEKIIAKELERLEQLNNNN